MNNAYLARAKKVIPDPQILSIVVAKRAKQIALGARPMVKCDSDNVLDVALLEVAENLLSYEFGALDHENDAAAAEVAEAAAANDDSPAE